MARQKSARLEDLNYQYLPGRTVSNPGDYLAASAKRSAATRRRLACSLDIAYGDSKGQILDIFPGRGNNSPVHIFIHGGYWRAKTVDKRVYSHVAAPLVAAGACVVLLDYDLCPSVSISEIVTQVRRAMVWVYRNIASYNGDRKQLYLSGHSAGGHLAAMMMSTDWKSQAGLPKSLIKGAVLLSGLFDIEPHRHTELQQDIRLGAGEAKAMSPMKLEISLVGPCLLAVGEKEPDLFHWQSLAYAARLRLQGVPAEYRSMPGDNHFSLTDRLGRARDPLTRALISQMF